MTPAPFSQNRASARFVARFARTWAGAALVAVAVIALAALWLRMGPLPPGLLDGPANPSTLVVDRNGTPLREALSSDQTRGVQLTADSLPPALVT